MSPPGPSAPDGHGFSYDEAFARHLGLIGPEEQDRLRRSRVAVLGMGGVGGTHLITLTRLGVGSFHVADPDRFEVANFNRQYGASTRTLGRGKAEVMAEEARAINPGLDLRVFAEAVTPANVAAVLDGVDVLIDGIDFFSLDARRMVFREARARGIWAVTAGPLGFSTAYLVFSPTGMSFDDYFDFAHCADRLDQLIAFVVGLAPRATHREYLDFSSVNPRTGRGPSAGLACNLCSGVATVEVMKILLKRSPVRPAPCYFQFDAYRQVYARGRLPLGNRHPWRRLLRRVARRKLQQLGWTGPPEGS